MDREMIIWHSYRAALSRIYFFLCRGNMQASLRRVWTLFHSHFAAVLLYLIQVFIDVRDVYCADIGAYRSVCSGLSSLPFHQAAIDSWLALAHRLLRSSIPWDLPISLSSSRIHPRRTFLPLQISSAYISK